jgi:RNA-directed DNA polymerase
MPSATRHVDQGCDFLGFSIRRYHGRLPLIRPSNDAVKRIRLRLRTEMRALLGSNAAAIMRTLTPVIRGWAAYCVSRGCARPDWRAVALMV